MEKSLKILIIGFGSIGQRHHKNLVKLGYRDVWAYDVDNTKIQKYLSAPACAGRQAGKNTKIIKQININTLKQFDVAFICSPNNLHIQHALKCAQVGCYLFIEKPLSNNLSGISKLQEVCRQNKLINMVACNMRFHPCLSYIKKYLDKNKLGQIYSISHEFGYYLPFWRPGTDYKKNYAAKKKTGGGIILDDIHEFDLLLWLNNFTEVLEVKFIYDKISDLQIETEDYCLANFKFKNKVLGQVKSDYLQKKYTRNCKIVGAKGNLEWDFNENIVWFHSNGKSKKLFEVEKYNLNKMYIEEVKYFLNCVDKKKETFNNIKTAGVVLKYCVNKG